MNTNQIAAEAVQRWAIQLRQWLGYDVPQRWIDSLTVEIQTAIEKAQQPAHEVLDKLGALRSEDDETYTVAQRILLVMKPRAAPSFAKATEGKHASEPSICDQCSRKIEDGSLYNDHSE